MGSLAVSSDWWNDDWTVFVFQFSRGKDRYSAIFHSKVVNSFGVFNRKSNVPNTISMLNKMSVHIFVGVLLINRAEDKDWAFSILNNMTGNTSFTSFKSFVGKIVKTKSTGVERGGLFGVTNPECDVI